MTELSPHTPTKQARLDALEALMMRCIADGKLTDEELILLQHTRDALRLSPEEVRSLRARVYNTAFRRAEEDGGIGLGDAELLNRIVQFLNGGVWLTEHFSKSDGGEAS